jgi:hypothetical protein
MSRVRTPSPAPLTLCVCASYARASAPSGHRASASGEMLPGWQDGMTLFDLRASSFAIPSRLLFSRKSTDHTHRCSSRSHSLQVLVPCATCANMNPPDVYLLLGSIADSGLVSVRCPRGHNSMVVYQERRHMLLMKSACLAYLDGHLRESVSSMGAGLERCYEFYIRAALASRLVDTDTVARAWKQVANQSERQFGAFLFLYLACSGQVFPSVQENSRFRNSVIHQGYIPSAAEVIDYGRTVFSLLLAIEQQADNLGNGATSRVDAEAVSQQVSSIPAGTDYVKLKTMIVSVDERNQGVAVTTFDELLAGLKERREGR